MPDYVVYVHVNRINGKAYVGQTHQPISKRWKDYAYIKCPLFYRAIKRYGFDSFEHIVLETGLTPEEADNKERHYIEVLQTTNPRYGYNCESGGCVSKEISEHTRQKLRVYNLGKRYSDDTKEKHRLHIQSREKAFPDYNYEKLRQLLSISINQYDMNKRFIKQWDSATQAAKELHLTRQNINKCLSGKRRTSGGYYWSYTGCTIKESHVKQIQVLMIDVESDNVVMRFESIMDAQIKTGINKTNISAVCHGKRQMAGGYKWKYEYLEEFING